MKRKGRSTAPSMSTQKADVAQQLKLSVAVEARTICGITRERDSRERLDSASLEVTKIEKIANRCAKLANKRGQ